MKKMLIVVAGLFSALLLSAQPAPITIYGFRQQYTGGMQKQGDIDEQGHVLKEKPNGRFKHSIYLTTTDTQRIHPVQLWIKGKAYGVKAELVTKIPVIQTNTDAPAATLQPLIPETAGRVWRLHPVADDTLPIRKRETDLAGDNEMVVVYKMNGKLHYGVLKKFTDLTPVALQ